MAMKKVIAANWKMHGSTKSITDLVGQILASVDAGMHDTQVVLFPSSPYISLTKSLLADRNWYVGAQDISEYSPGAYTGDVAGSMLRDLGCTHVLVGHSERRHVFGESNELVAKKLAKAIEYKLLPILCVGETIKQRDAGSTLETVDNQLQSVLDLPNGSQLIAQSLIAYEPVWAIGSGLAASVSDANEVHAHIKGRLESLGINGAAVLYGGSVNPENGRDFLSSQLIDGVLVGGASLDASKFVGLLECIK